MTENKKGCATTAGLIFPTQATNNIDTQLRYIGKSRRSVQNRLRSIVSDANFVSFVASQLNLPLISNERCGSWYVRPELRAASVYFKSTDGHFGQWNISLRRLNLHILDVIGENGGCIIVDSTRSGKALPDALSKTVPMWCAVLNRLLFPEIKESHAVSHLRELVSDSEHSCIEERMNGVLQRVKALDLNVSKLRDKLDKPMKIIWIARTLGLVPPMILPSAIELGQSHPVFLCMASVTQSMTEQSLGGVYIQGAGDDSEGWSQGMTPELFWSHREEFLKISSSDVSEFVKALIEDDVESGSAATPGNPGCYRNEHRFAAITPGSWIFVGSMSASLLADSKYSFVISCSLEKQDIASEQMGSRTLNLTCGSGKVGSRSLRQELNKVPKFVEGKPIQKLFVRCSNGKDISVGVALTLLVLYTDNNGLVSDLSSGNRKDVDKELIRKKLSWIMASIPSACPSRATLTAVNSFLMQRQK